MCILVQGVGFGADTGSIEPPEPDIVLPEVVLTIEDLSIESIDALVPQDEIDIPDPGTALPEVDDYTVTLPEPELGIEGEDIYRVQQGGSSVSAEVLLGAGIVNYLIGRISVFNPVGDLRYGFVFDHGAVDGFSFRPAGNGFSKRVDSLDGNLKYLPEKLKVELSGNFTDKETGLQGESDFFSEGKRFLYGSGLLALTPVEYFTFTLRADTGLTSYMLTGNNAAAYPGVNELLLAGQAAADFVFKPVETGLSVRYAYRNVFDAPLAEIHRLLVNAHVGGDFDNGFSFLANGGFFISAPSTWFFPFEVGISSVLGEGVSVGIKGGFRVVENNLRNTLDSFSYADPSPTVPDVYGWFGRGNVQFDVLSALLVSLDLGVDSDSTYRIRGPVNPVTGLFALDEVANVLSLDFGGALKWNMADWFSFSAKNRTTMFLNAPIPAKNEIGADAVFSTANEAFVATVSASMPLDFEAPDYLPYLNTDVAFKIAEHVKLSVEGRDLLAPVIDNRRVIREPFISEGIQVIMKILVNF